MLDWSLQWALWKVQDALSGVIENLPNRAAAAILCPLVFPLGARRRPPSDDLGARVARDLLDDKELRLHLTSDIYVPKTDEPGLGKLESALDLVVAAQHVQNKVREAARTRRLGDLPREEMADEALSQGIITKDEHARLAAAEKARDDAIQVDAFDPGTYLALK